MWKNNVDPERPQMTVWRMRIACWVPKTTNTLSGYVILIALLLQQWLHARASLLCYTKIACLFYVSIYTSALQVFNRCFLANI